MIDIEHDSRERFYRKPFGAVVCGTRIRLRVSVMGAGIPNSVKLIYTLDGGEPEDLDMHYLFSMGDRSIYSIKFTVPESECLVWYYFKIDTGLGTFFYGNNPEGLGGRGRLSIEKPSNSFQITVYKESYKTPEWFKHCVAYQIFPDRFFNGNEDGSFLGNRTDIIKRKWGEQPYYKTEQYGDEYLNNDFFGGNLKGIIKKLPYLKDLGISVIYLNPIFRASSNHKYDTGSYEEIDPMFGDIETFKGLCSEAKDMGIRIILDGVFNHVGSNSQYFNKNGEYDSVGAYQSKDSPYYSWFRFFDYPDSYESWWGVMTLPQVEEHDESYRNYILHNVNSIIKRWIRNGASGWRLDVVDELPDFFVKELRSEVKSVDDDAVIIGEVWEDASNKSAYGERRQYFLGDELDSVMNYPMRLALIDAVLGHIDAAGLDARLMSIKENYPREAYYSLLNIISSHDVERIMTLMGNAPSRHNVDKEYQSKFKLEGYSYDVAKEKACLVMGLQMMLPGVPCVYYGDEIGMQGYGDPFCRGCFDWENRDEYVFTKYKTMIGIRNSSPAFSLGEYESLYKIGSVYGFIRYYGDEIYIIVANMGKNFDKIRLDSARFEICTLDIVSEDSGEHHDSPSGVFYIDIPANWLKVYKCSTLAMPAVRDNASDSSSPDKDKSAEPEAAKTKDDK